MSASTSLFSYSKYLALRSSGRQAAVRGAAPAWLAGQAARCRLAAFDPYHDVALGAEPARVDWMINGETLNG